jgi:hypothetical protein
MIGRRWREEEDDGFAKLPLNEIKTVHRISVQFKTAITFTF